MPTSLGPAEILVILVVALIVLGPNKLPQAGRQLGKAIAEVRRWTHDMTNEIKTAVDLDDRPKYPPTPNPPTSPQSTGVMPEARPAPPAPLPEDPTIPTAADPTAAAPTDPTAGPTAAADATAASDPSAASDPTAASDLPMVSTPIPAPAPGGSPSEAGPEPPQGDSAHP